MPRYIITIHLDGGGSATLTEDAQNPGLIEALISQQLRQTDPRFRLQFPRSVIDVEKAKVVGWSIDEG